MHGSGGRTFAAVQLSTAAYLAVCLYHAVEMDGLRCLLADSPVFGERCRQLQLSREVAANSAWRHRLYLAGLLACASLIFARGAMRRVLAFFLLFCWLTHISEIAFATPHIEYVSLTLLYLASAPAHGTGAQSAFLSAVMRAALAVGYGWSSAAKLLLTPAWRLGRAFAIISRTSLRDGFPRTLASLLAHPLVSPPLSYVAILTEGALPLLEFLAVVTSCERLSQLGIFASAGMQLGILILMPLTDVSVAMLIFHLALVDANAAAQAVMQPAVAGVDGGRDAATDKVQSPRRTSSSEESSTVGCHVRPRMSLPSRLGVSLLLGAIFSLRPAQCFVRPMHARRFRGETTTACATLVKGLLPLPATSWETWPCKPYTIMDHDDATEATEAMELEDEPCDTMPSDCSDCVKYLPCVGDTPPESLCASVPAKCIDCERWMHCLDDHSAAGGGSHRAEGKLGARGAPSGNQVFPSLSAERALRLAEMPMSKDLAIFADATGQAHVRSSGMAVFGGASIYMFGGGGHFWHVAVGVAFRAAEEILDDTGRADEPMELGVAALVCACSPFSANPLATNIRRALMITEYDIEWFKMGAGLRHDCRTGFCRGVGSGDTPQVVSVEVGELGNGDPWTDGGAQQAMVPLMRSGAEQDDVPIEVDVAAVVGECAPHCESPCDELNGNYGVECSGCVGAEWSCRPGADGFPLRRAEASTCEAGGEEGVGASGSCAEGDAEAGVALTAAGGECAAHCESPCDELNGDFAVECSGCISGVWSCRPGAAGFPPQRTSCEDASFDDICSRLAGKGMCLQPEHADEMRRACRASCGWCDSTQAAGEYEVAAARAAQPAVPRRPAGLGPTLDSWCGNATDEAQLGKQGYVVLRNLVPPHELAMMDGYARGLGEPLRFLCGLPYDQRPECVYPRAAALRKSYPETVARLEAIFARWVANGFSSEAELGWPLEVVGGEYIAVSKWPFKQNASCTLASIFDATKDTASPCLRKCPDAKSISSLSRCWQLCMYNAIVYRTPRGDVRQVLAAAENSVSCDASRYALLDGPMDSIAGSGGRFRLVQNTTDGPALEQCKEGEAAAGTTGGGGGASRCLTMRLLSHLRAHLTQVHGSVSLYTGYHGWHVDGDAARHGREHKAYVLVSKGGNVEQSNLRVVPSHALAWPRDRRLAGPVFSAPTIAGCDAEFCRTPPPAAEEGEVARKQWRQAEALKGRGSFGALASDPLASLKLSAWGVSDEDQHIDRLGCDMSLAPGDVLFWREDVWHRTQDVESDRVALRIDVLRFPFATDVTGYGS